MPIYQKSNGKWAIQNVAGESDTRADAEERLRAIKARQAAEKAGNK